MTDVATDSTQATPKSTFVTVVGWIFAVLSAFGLLIMVFEGLMMKLMFANGQFADAFASVQDNAEIPAFSRWGFEHLWLILIGIATYIAIELVFSIGLLRRRNWGRVGFMVLMMLATLYNVVSVVVSFFFFDLMPFPNDAEIMAQAKTFFYPAIAFNDILSLAFAVLFVWIAWKLTTPKIRAEFS